MYVRTIDALEFVYLKTFCALEMIRRGFSARLAAADALSIPALPWNVFALYEHISEVSL
jgi:hypothetical protein